MNTNSAGDPWPLQGVVPDPLIYQFNHQYAKLLDDYKNLQGLLADSEHKAKTYLNALNDLGRQLETANRKIAALELQVLELKTNKDRFEDLDV